MNEIEEKVDHLLDTALGKCNLKEQQFVSRFILGEDPLTVIKDVYRIQDDAMAKIKQLTLLAIPEVSKAISELQKSFSIVIKAKMNNMLPEALDIMGEAMNKKIKDDPYFNVNVAKDVAKMGLDLMKEDNRKSPGEGMTIKIDNVTVNSAVAADRITAAFMGKKPEVIDAEIVEDDESEENNE